MNTLSIILLVLFFCLLMLAPVPVILFLGIPALAGAGGAYIYSNSARKE